MAYASAVKKMTGRAQKGMQEDAGDVNAGGVTKEPPVSPETKSNPKVSYGKSSKYPGGDESAAVKSAASAELQSFKTSAKEAQGGRKGISQKPNQN